MPPVYTRGDQVNRPGGRYHGPGTSYALVVKVYNGTVPILKLFGNQMYNGTYCANIVVYPMVLYLY